MRPDYIATAQKEPSLLHKDLLASKLARSNSTLQEAEEPRAKIQLCDIAKDQVLCDVAHISSHKAAMLCDLAYISSYKAAPTPASS
jgi:hypothetical protein